MSGHLPADIPLRQAKGERERDWGRFIEASDLPQECSVKRHSCEKDKENNVRHFVELVSSLISRSISVYAHITLLNISLYDIIQDQAQHVFTHSDEYSSSKDHYLPASESQLLCGREH